LAIHDARAEGRLEPGDRVVLTAFGAGFVWGAALLRWGIAGESARHSNDAEIVHA
jgi:3-oxoacyl-[acyl-carrier-protein] synthase-3